MRSSVITNVIVLFGLHLSYWCWNTVDASGGALDTSSNFQSGSTGGSHSKVTAFSATLTDGLAQAVAHEAGKFYFYYLNQTADFYTFMKNLKM